MADPINKPSHYQVFPGTEAIDIIKKTLTPEEYAGYCKGNILKYRLRAGKKDAAAQDLGKAAKYEEFLAGAVLAADLHAVTVPKNKKKSIYIDTQGTINPWTGEFDPRIDIDFTISPEEVADAFKPFCEQRIDNDNDRCRYYTEDTEVDRLINVTERLLHNRNK